jgi:hypothetical protein
LALAALGWCLAGAHARFADVSAALVGRSAGLILFGIAMAAAGLVFRAAMTASRAAPVKAAPLHASEFRRGFGDRIVRAKAQLRQPTQREVVVELRRAVAAQERTSQKPAAIETLPAAEIARLQSLLHKRAAHLRSRHAEQAKRLFLRSGVDGHGLAGN